MRLLHWVRFPPTQARNRKILNSLCPHPSPLLGFVLIWVQIREYQKKIVKSTVSSIFQVLVSSPICLLRFTLQSLQIVALSILSLNLLERQLNSCLYRFYSWIHWERQDPVYLLHLTPNQNSPLLCFYNKKSGSNMEGGLDRATPGARVHSQFYLSMLSPWFSILSLLFPFLHLFLPSFLLSFLLPFLFKAGSSLLQGTIKRKPHRQWLTPRCFAGSRTEGFWLPFPLSTRHSPPHLPQ